MARKAVRWPVSALLIFVKFISFDFLPECFVSPVGVQTPFLARIRPHHHNFPKTIFQKLPLKKKKTCHLQWQRSGAPPRAPEPEIWPGSTEGKDRSMNASKYFMVLHGIALMLQY